METTSFSDPYLQSILEELAKKEGFKRPTYSITAGSNPGDNFIGRIYRTVINEENLDSLKDKSLSLIFKVSPACKIRQEKLSVEQAFITESAVYQVVLPTFHKLLNKYGVINARQFPGTARCVTARLNGFNSEYCDVLVLQDKCLEGYRMFKETKSLDADHCRQVLRKLALLHAASLALYRHEPEIAENLTKAISGRMFYSDVNHVMMTEMQKSAMSSLEMLPEPYQKGNPIYEKVEEMVFNFNTELTTANEPPTDIPCIIHGDSYFNNVLFKYTESGIVEDACLVDFQHARVASPAVELSYLIFTCTTKEVRDSHYEDLIGFYHKEISSHLKKMDLDPEAIIPWDRLQRHLRLYSKTGILMAIAGLPIITADNSDIKYDVNAVDQDGDILAGCADIKDPAKISAISQRVADVIHDAFQWNYL